MKKRTIPGIVTAILLLLMGLPSFSQVAINTDGSPPDSSAGLDVKFSDKGLLPPRMTHAQMNAIHNPANGLIIYCTDCSNSGTGALAMFISGAWYMFSPTCLLPLSPLPGIHVPLATQITWNWTAVTDATGYKWNTTNNEPSATDLGNLTTKTETGLSCDTSYTRYVWSYNVCGPSAPTPLSASTPAGPAVSVTIAASANPVCTGASVTFTATPINGGTSPAYQWKKGGIDITGATNSSYSYTPANLDVISCRLISSLTCTTTNPAYSNNITMAVTPVPAPPAFATHVAAQTQIIWNWTTVPGAAGYKWNTTDDYGTAIDMGSATTKTETGLTCNTPYTRYAWAYNTCGNSTAVAFNQTTSACGASSCAGMPTVSYGGQTYNTVQISSQCWLKENLNIGTMISGSSDQTNNGVIEKYCNNNNPANCAVYGGLYQWNEMMQYVTMAGVQGICPSGWHIPTDAEWTTVTTFLGGTSVAGGKMKTTGTIQAGTGLWYSPNTAATNESGFSAVPAGNRGIGGAFFSLGGYGLYWSSAEFSTSDAWYRGLGYGNGGVDRSGYFKNDGFSVRCIRDTCSVLPSAPASGSNAPSSNQIIWNWSTIQGAAGYKWNTTNDYITAIDMGTATTKTETGLACNAAYTRYVWAYNACGNSGSTALSQSTTNIDAVAVSISVSDNGVCSGSSVTFTATPTNGGTAPVYQWKVNGSNMGTNSPTCSYVPVNNDHVWCILTSNASCVSGNPAISDTITMGVFQNTPVSLSITTPSNTACDGVAVTFTALPVNGGVGPLTQWYVNGTARLGEWYPTFTYVPYNGDVVNCNMYASVVCPTVYPAWSNEITMTVNTTPVSPLEGTHIATTNQIEWHWNTVTGATGFKWNTVNDTATAINMGTLTTKTETGLTCNTAYIRYVWAYNACGKSMPVTLNQMTLTNPPAPIAGTHVSQPTQITWNWNTVAGATGYKWNTTNNYSTATEMGTLTTKTETGLVCNTAYTRYAWAYNTCGNSNPVALTQSTSDCGASSCAGTPTVSYGGQTYNTVQIGSQCWLKENLNIGTMISGSSDQINNGVVEKYCFDNNPANCAVYGGLYQWNEMMQYVTTAGVQGICPSGWHIPADAEWAPLTIYVNSQSAYLCNSIYFAKAMAATTLWNSSGNTCAIGNNLSLNNATGFSAVPAGYRFSSGTFVYLGNYGCWWSSTEFDTSIAWYLSMIYDDGDVNRIYYPKHFGFSVRCLRD